MKFDARVLLIVASILTLVLLAASDVLPMLFVLLASELGAIICAVGLWFLYKEINSSGMSTFRALAAVGFVLLGVRFLASGWALLQGGLTTVS